MYNVSPSMIFMTLSVIHNAVPVHFDVLVVGDDWKNKYLSGIDWIRKHESKVVIYLSRTPGISTTSIREKLEDY